MDDVAVRTRNHRENDRSLPILFSAPKARQVAGESGALASSRRAEDRRALALVPTVGLRDGWVNTYLS